MENRHVGEGTARLGYYYCFRYIEVNIFSTLVFKTVMISQQNDHKNPSLGVQNMIDLRSYVIFVDFMSENVSEFSPANSLITLSA